MAQLTTENFIDSLFLLLRKNDDQVRKIVVEVLAIYEKEARKNSGLDSETTTMYAYLLKEVLNSGIKITDRAGVDAFILKLRNNKILSKDPDSYSSLKRLFLDDKPLDEETYRYYCQKLKNVITFYKDLNSIKQVFHKLTLSQAITEIPKQEKLLNEITELCSQVVANNRDALATEEDEHTARNADFTDKDSLLRAMTVYRETNIANKFKMGLQGLNRAMNGGLKVGEALRNSTLVRVPGGWTAIGLLKEGDTVVTPYGTLTQVTGVFPQGKRQLYRIYFNGETSDRLHVDADINHRWEVCDEYDNSRTVTTHDLISMLNRGAVVRVPRVFPASSDAVIDLAIDSYLLGVLTNAKLERQKLYIHCKTALTRETIIGYLNGFYNTIQRLDSRLIVVDLSNASTLTEFVQKHFTNGRLSSYPVDISLMSAGQKHRFFEGLLASYHGNNSIGIACYSESVVKQLRDMMRSMGRSLKTCKIDGQYHCHITEFSSYDQVVKIELIEGDGGIEEATCIAVDDPCHLYVIENYIVTHNSMVINSLSHNGKALVHGTPVKVPGGWKMIEDIRPGDIVTAVDGTQTRVMNVFPQGLKKAVRVTFEDGRFVDTCEEHLWSVKNSTAIKRYATKSSREIMYEMMRNRKTFRVPLCHSEVSEDKTFPLHPYVVGALIGAGSLDNGRVELAAHKSIVDRVEKILIDSVKMVQYPYDSYHSSKGVIENIKGHEEFFEILNKLGFMGKSNPELFIPAEYVNGSTRQRLELLQGILDSLGGVVNRRTEDGDYYTSGIKMETRSLRVAHGVRYLILSLGGTCTISKNVRRSKIRKNIFITEYRVIMRIKNNKALFGIRAKKEKVVTAEIDYDHSLQIASVVPLGKSLECTCIEVDHPTHLFVTKDFIVTHNTLTLLKIARWIATLNKVDETYKNPCLLFFSLENETPQNIRQLFEEFYISENRKLPPTDWTDAQISEYVCRSFNANGWKFLIRRRVGAEFGYDDLVAEFIELKEQGFTPLAVIIDYVNMMKKEGNVENVGNHLQIRQLYTNLCNFLKAHNCCFVTAHQLNRKAAEVVRMNPVGAVKKFTMDMLADSTDPQREVDMVFYQHKEMDTSGNAWLTFKLDKHRYDTTTPEKDKYFAYKFEGPLGIMDDFAGEDASTDNIYAVKAKNDDDEDEDVTNVFK